MGRIPIELIGLGEEPSGLDKHYETLRDAKALFDACHHVVPSALQSQAYARVVLEHFIGHGLAEERTRVRLAREKMLGEEGVARMVLIGQRALAQVGIFSPDIMVPQIEEIIRAVERDITAGQKSTLQVGILPNPNTEPLADPLLLTQPKDDVMTIQTPKGLHVVTADGFAVDRVDGQSVRAGEANRRLRAIQEHISQAAFGEDAKAILRSALDQVSKR